MPPPGAARHTSAGWMAMRLRARRERCGCARWTYSTSSARTSTGPLLLPLLLTALALALPMLLCAVPVLLWAISAAALLPRAAEHARPDVLHEFWSSC